MSESRGSGGRRVAGTHRSIVAALVIGSLAIQFAWVPSSFGAPVSGDGAATSPAPDGPTSAHSALPSDPGPEHGLAEAPPVVTVPGPPGDRGSQPMPCGEGGQCGWGLMNCDGAGTCFPLQILATDRAADEGSAAGLPPGPRSLTEPTSGARLPEGPPPRA